MKRLFTALIALAAIVAFLAPFSPTKTASADTDVANYREIHALNLEFDQASITIPADSQVTITLFNDENSIFHNIAVDVPDAATLKPCQGQCTQTLTFMSPDPGLYHFKCTLHDAMVGDLIVQ